jgi:predicted AAA+ superfamily ATPase
MRRLHSGTTPAVSLRGPRQVGKTTVQEQIIEELLKLRKINPARILRVQFDEVPALGNFRSPIAALVSWYEANVLRGSLNAMARRGEPAYLFFDEVQNLKTWDTQLKSLVDHVSANTLVTGSSALRIAGGHDSLAGRISMLEMGPLRLHEIAGIRQLGSMAPFQSKIELEAWTKRDFWLELLAHFRRHERVARMAFEAFSDLGGYPVCHKGTETPAHLADLIVRTVVDRTFIHDLNAGPGGKRRDRRVLEETFRRVCRYTGQAVRPQRIREELEPILGPGVRVKPISDAIRFLIDALLIHEIQPLEALTKRQAHPAKLCLCDHFVREAWLQEKVPIAPSQLSSATEAVSTLAGHIVESVVGFYFKGIAGLDVSWFPERRDEPEVDYVLSIGMSRIPVEVKYQHRPKPKDYQGIRSFCERPHYNAPFGLVITQEASGEVAEGVIAVPASALLALH